GSRPGGTRRAALAHSSAGTAASRPVAATTEIPVKPEGPSATTLSTPAPFTDDEGDEQAGMAEDARASSTSAMATSFTGRPDGEAPPTPGPRPRWPRARAPR